MARSYRYLHYDVFTDHLFGGNQLAVVLDGRGLSTATMQAVAKEMNFSETTFVLPPERPDTDARMRIFTPGDELPMAGHPTIGSTFALARSGVIFSAEQGDDRATVYSRMFAPALGVAEDPATGSASGPLGCYLVRHNLVSPERAGAMLSLQGVRMGRPSHVHISIQVENGDITLVRVGGESVLAGEGTLYI
jgi:predicted PhzF superfamily epimerase YddE/YHI9